MTEDQTKGKVQITAEDIALLQEYLRTMDEIALREPQKLPVEIWDKAWAQIHETGEIPEEYRDRIGVRDVLVYNETIDGVTKHYPEGINRKSYYDIEWESWNREREHIEGEYHDVLLKALRYALVNGTAADEVASLTELLKGLINDTEKLTLEQVQAALPRLSSTIPKHYYMPNNKLAKQMTKDIVDGGVLELVVSNKQAPREITTQCLLVYEGDRVKLRGKKPFTEFKRTIYNGIISLYVDGDESHIMTPAMIYRAANGITDSSDPSKEMKEEIARAVNEMNFIEADIDFTEEAKMYHSAVDNCKIKDTILDVRELNVTAGGKQYKAFYIKRLPLLYEYAQVSEQIASVPPQLLDIKQVTKDADGNVIKSRKPGGRISNNDRRMAVKSYLLRRVYDIQHGNGSISNHILYSTMYEEIATESEKEFTAKEQRNIREYVPQVLDYWTHQNFISGYRFLKSGNKITGVEINMLSKETKKLPPKNGQDTPE